MKDEAQLRANISAIGGRFLERTTGELPKFRAALARLDQDPKGALDELQNLAHRVCGTGATLGFMSLSNCAGEIEQTAYAALSSTQISPASLLQQLTEQILRLEAETVKTTHEYQHKT